MKKILTVIVVLVIAGGLIGGGVYLGSHKSNGSASAGTSNTSRQPDLTKILANLQKQYPTVKQTYVYTEQRDPNNDLGKTGYYIAGAEFYDTRTNTEPDGDAFGADSGGAIEVYANSSDASKRVDYLKQFQGSGALDPGAFKQVGNVVIRASSQYTSSEQNEMINYLATQF